MVSTARRPELPVERIRLDGVDWETYEKLLAAIGEQHLRCNYDRGRLEIMAPLRIHEREKKLLASMVERITEVRDLPFEPCGSMTIRRKDLKKGFEPDECFYIEHAEQMREWREPDFTTDPPPDLAIEVDVTSSSVDRQLLYASLGIPELWRFDGEFVEILLLSAGTYQKVDASRSFPFLTAADINRFLAMYDTMTFRDVLKQVESWLRGLPHTGG